jgi:ADP-ribosyl-[dinitrogen reductase] hydrolase
MTDKPLILLGAIAGDMIGCPYEHAAYKSVEFELFSPDSQLTDDSVLTIAVADAILNHKSYQAAILEWARRYPNSGYGGYFYSWMHAPNPQPYNSFGNGSAMRVSAVGWAFDSVEEVLRQAEAGSIPTHNHPEGIKGAQATALAVFMARKGWEKEEMRAEISAWFGYDLKRTIEEIRPIYVYNETCQETVPEALVAFLDAQDFEDSIRLAVSLGGDADTLAAISGAVAEAYYGGVPEDIAREVRRRLPDEMWRVVEGFNGACC